MPKHFQFKVQEVDTDGVASVEVVFEGELKGENDFQSEEFQKLEKQIRSDAQSKLIFFNLNKVGYWDTQGMRSTLLLAHDINEKIGYKRVSIVAPKLGYLFQRAKEKYDEITDGTVPWNEVNSIR